MLLIRREFPDAAGQYIWFRPPLDSLAPWQVYHAEQTGPEAQESGLHIRKRDRVNLKDNCHQVEDIAC